MQRLFGAIRSFRFSTVVNREVAFRVHCIDPESFRTQTLQGGVWKRLRASKLICVPATGLPFGRQPEVVWIMWCRDSIPRGWA